MSRNPSALGKPSSGMDYGVIFSWTLRKAIQYCGSSPDFVFVYWCDFSLHYANMSCNLMVWVRKKDSISDFLTVLRKTLSRRPNSELYTNCKSCLCSINQHIRMDPLWLVLYALGGLHYNPYSTQWLSGAVDYYLTYNFHSSMSLPLTFGEPVS